MCMQQTLLFVKFSQRFEGKTSQEFNLRCIQRFFADFVTDNHLIDIIVFTSLSRKPLFNISIDRTNWFDELIRCKISLYIKNRGNMKLYVPDKSVKKIFWFFNQLKVNKFFNCDSLVYV